MFYEKQPKQKQYEYKRMLSLIGNLTLLFSESDCPYLPYRCHENIFCKYFEAENLGRKDCSADAKKGRIGIGLKTWMGNDDQKVAEFNKLKSTYDTLDGLELVRKISEFRNERIRITENLYGIDKMIYHIVKRVSGKMEILELAFDYIDIENITLIKDRGNVNNTYFTDGKHVYHFSTSKNTLYMIFDDMILLDSIDIEIMADPYDYLLQMESKEEFIERTGLGHKVIDYKKNQLCLRLYSTSKDIKFVAEKSGLNQWNAGGRRRDNNEIYIPFPAEDRNRNVNFFPPRNQSFNLTLPDGTKILAKICQEDGKAIMSNPNKVLGEWLLRKVFEIPEGTVVTYEMLEKFNIDSVIFTKIDDLNYTIDFSEIGTYEEFYKKIED